MPLVDNLAEKVLGPQPLGRLSRAGIALVVGQAVNHSTAVENAPDSPPGPDCTAAVTAGHLLVPVVAIQTLPAQEQ